MGERTYYIVNPAGAIHEVTREHMKVRLAQPGFRAPTAEELKEYRLRREHGNQRRQGGGRPFIQRFDRPLAEPFSTDPDDQMEQIERELGEFESKHGGEELPDATDAAEDLAAELEVDLRDVEGTGADGRILKGDVMDHFEGVQGGEDEGGDDE